MFSKFSTTIVNMYLRVRMCQCVTIYVICAALQRMEIESMTLPSDTVTYLKSYKANMYLLYLTFLYVNNKLKTF